MKKLIFISILFISSFSYSQFLEDGFYSFTDGDKYTLNLEICDGGGSICSFDFMFDKNTLDFTESGEWFRVNLNGLGENYEGPTGWYQVNSKNISYKFESLSNGSFVLSRGEKRYLMTMMQ